jgi:hypothetical protein
MPYAISPQFRAKEKQYVLVSMKDQPRIVELDHLEEALKEGAEYYPKANSAFNEDWIEIPDHHFRQLEQEGCLDEMEWLSEESADPEAS